LSPMCHRGDTYRSVSARAPRATSMREERRIGRLSTPAVAGEAPYEAASTETVAEVI
jgi:hypothetical protein